MGLCAFTLGSLKWGTRLSALASIPIKQPGRAEINQEQNHPAKGETYPGMIIAYFLNPILLTLDLVGFLFGLHIFSKVL